MLSKIEIDFLFSQGLKFAPPSLAAYFSIKEETEYNYSNISSFGFHDSIRSPSLRTDIALH